MSEVARRVKQPAEKQTYSFDFTTKLKPGDSVGAINGVTSLTSGLVIGSPTLEGNVVSVQISSGTDGVRYIVSCAVTSTPGADVLGLVMLLGVDILAN
jgi:hypothetical protein